MVGVDITIIRDPRERFRRCSLRPIREHPRLRFFKARGDFLFDGTGFTLLEIGAPRLSATDRGRPLLLLDGSWRRLPQIRRRVIGRPVGRSLPGIGATAYPRSSRIFRDPPEGLASVEALYLATALLGSPDPSLLDGYPWREAFLAAVAPHLSRS